MNYRIRTVTALARQAAIDLAEAATLAPGVSFVRKNLAVMGEELPAVSLARGEED